MRGFGGLKVVMDAVGCDRVFSISFGYVGEYKKMCVDEYKKFDINRWI